MSRRLIPALAILACCACPLLADEPAVVKPVPDAHPTVKAPIHGVDPQAWVEPDCGCQKEEACQGGGGFYAQGGVSFLRPTWETNPAFFSGTNLNAAGQPTFETDNEFDWDFEAAPHAEVGYLNANRFGGRARYTQFDHGAGAAFTVLPGNTAGSARPLGLAIPIVNAGQTVQISSNLDFYVIDAEVMKVWQRNKWRLEGSAGVRYLDLEQSYRFAVLNGQTLVSRSSIEGFGPTVSFEARRAIGCSGLSIFAGTRLSILFGDEAQDASLIGGERRITDTESVQPIGEIEGGVNWTGEWGSAQPFIEVAGVGQVWWGAGNASNSHLADQPAGGYDNSNMGLLGARVSAGVNY